MRRSRVAPSATGDKIRAYARAYAAAGQKEHAEGMIQAADTVDVDLAGTSTGVVDDPLLVALMTIVQSLTKATERLTEAVADVRAIVADAAPATQQAVRGRVLVEKASRGVATSTAAVIGAPAQLRGKSKVKGRQSGERRILTAAAQYTNGVTRKQLTVLIGLKGSTRNAYIQRLRERGHLTDTDRIRITAEGRQVLGVDFKPLPTGPALVEYWRGELPEPEMLVLEALLVRAPQTREEIGALNPAWAVSTRNAYIHRLRAKELIYSEGDLLYPDEQLTNGG
jgi:hypothetical protein